MKSFAIKRSLFITNEDQFTIRHLEKNNFQCSNSKELFWNMIRANCIIVSSTTCSVERKSFLRFASCHFFQQIVYAFGEFQTREILLFGNFDPGRGMGDEEEGDLVKPGRVPVHDDVQDPVRHSFVEEEALRVPTSVSD